MPIIFSINQSGGYFISRYMGILSDAELVDAYRHFFEGAEWSPEFNELVDLSEADLSEITTNGVRKFVEFNEKVYRNHYIATTKVAVYAPQDFPFGLARMYSIMASGSPERVHVFRDIQSAELWLKE